MHPRREHVLRPRSSLPGMGEWRRATTRDVPPVRRAVVLPLILRADPVPLVWHEDLRTCGRAATGRRPPWRLHLRPRQRAASAGRIGASDDETRHGRGLLGRVPMLEVPAGYGRLPPFTASCGTRRGQLEADQGRSGHGVDGHRQDGRTGRPGRHVGDHRAPRRTPATGVGGHPHTDPQRRPEASSMGVIEHRCAGPGVMVARSARGRRDGHRASFPAP